MSTPAGAEPKKKTGLIIGGLVGVLALGGIGAAVLGGGGDDDFASPTTTVSPTTTAAPTTDAPSTIAPAVGPPTITELAQSTVQILVLDSAGTPTCVGSGTILDEQGTILTNAHVITPGNGCEVESIAIAITTDPGLPPEVLYFADLLNYDQSLDLAVLRIARPTDAAGSLPVSFPFTEVGDSDGVTIGDDIRILGYPTIGGDTITFTNGSVSGFTAQAGVSDRSWIKTDATIAGGNSGGTAINDEGQLIGIPTQAAATSGGEIADCRVVTDTNGDGVVDGADQCIPIGGFLNGIRPVNLATALIEDARTAAPLASNAAGQSAVTAVAIDLDSLFIYRPGFSTSVAEIETETDFVLTVAAGATELCFWMDWEGLPDGTNWTAAWFIDDEIIEDFSHFDQVWNYGLSGRDFWVCATAETGLDAGLYELAFLIDGEVIFIEGIAVTPTPAPVYEVEFANTSSRAICYLKVNPVGSSGVGLDELGTEQIIDQGQSYFMNLPEGAIVAAALDCDGEVISYNFEGIEVFEGQVVTISD